MLNEVLLYGAIYGWSADRAVSELNDARNSPHVTVRFNGDGGEVRYGWAIIGKTKELKGKKTFINDGEANSMMAFAFCYNEDNQALDTSVFKFHRASYGIAYEQSEYCTDSDLRELKEKNDKLRVAMESKLNLDAFRKITGYSMDDLFAMPGRVECSLTAEQAKECGLINKIIPITPEYKAQVQALASHYSPYKIAAIAEQTQTTMTKADIKAKFPEVYNEIYAAGKQKGIEQEFDRAGSILAFIEADSKGVIEAWKSKSPMTETQRSEFAIKAHSKIAVATIEGEAPAAVAVNAENSKPVADAKTEVEKKAKAEFDKAMDEEFKNRFPKTK